MSEFNQNSHLYLVDGSSFLFRAFHAIPLLTRKDGLPVNAVSGFCQMLFRLTDELPLDAKPTHLAVIFDPKGKNFRHDIYPQYKANRSAPPVELIPQFTLVRKAVQAFSILGIEVEGFEADDVIATYTKHALDKGGRVTIVSSDKDLMQIINDRVCLYDSMKNKTFCEPDVIEKFGVPPHLQADVQALCGDASDGISGVAGIGPKTAAELIRTFGSLEDLINRLDEIPQAKRRESLQSAKEMLPIYRQLVGLRQDVTVPFPLDDLAVADLDANTLMPFLKGLELRSLIRRMATLFDVDPNIFDVLSDPATDCWPMVSEELEPTPKSQAQQQTVSVQPLATLSEPFSLGSYDLPETVLRPIDRSQYKLIETVDDLQKLVKQLSSVTVCGFDTETTHLTPRFASLVGLSLATDCGKAFYIPVGHTQMHDAVRQLPKELVLSTLKPFLEAPDLLKVGQNLKYDRGILLNEGITLTAYDDTLLMAYDLFGLEQSNSLDALSMRLLDHETVSYETLTGQGKKQISFSEVSLEDATAYASEDADITLRLWHLLKKEMLIQQKNALYKRIDLPLVQVTSDMEFQGIPVDESWLKIVSAELTQTMSVLEQKIYDLAGKTFLISSPKQLGDILFESGLLDLKKKAKKTATGQYATGSDVLEELAFDGHELPKIILEWRHLHKLKTTYADALPKSIHPVTKRIHSSFSLAGTTTGRLSSSEPNLQNIPIKTPEGQKIRHAFIASEGHTLVCADYSQIELRLLAYMASVPALSEAFKEGKDIHALTASEVFHIPLDQVDSKARREAKTINFGIIYGQSPFGLANQLHIPQSEAKAYIEKYFARFPEIKDYMERTKEIAREKGYVETLLGRKVVIKNINAKQAPVRAFAERSAINAPIQGTAADIMRIAMKKADDWLKKEGLEARIVLQVHDELVIHTPEHETETVKTGIKQVMENAFKSFLDISIPLTVDVKHGKHWA